MNVLPKENRSTYWGLSRGNWITIILVIIPITFGGVYAYAQGTKQIEINTGNSIKTNERIDKVKTEVKEELKTLKIELTDIVNKQAEYRRQDMQEIRSLISDLNK